VQVYDTFVGNIAEDDVAVEGPTETVTVGEEQRRRSRFRAETDDGTDVGVVIGRCLREGDVLAADDDAPALVVALDPIEAVVVDLADADGPLTRAVALGHAAGNRHWDMAVRGDAVLFPAPASADRVDATLGEHLPDGATTGRVAVSPALFDGGGPGHGGGTDHTHSHGDGYTHGGTGHPSASLASLRDDGEEP
jgi:urease accessory protein